MARKRFKRGGRRKRSRRHGVKRRSAQSLFKLRRPKRRVVKQLAPIVETKKFRGIWNKNTEAEPRYEQTPVAAYDFDMPTTQAYITISPETFNRMQFQDSLQAHFAAATALDAAYGADVRTLAKSCIEGHSIFSKYLKAKVTVTYPRAAAAPVGAPRAMSVIWGWCNPLALTSHTAQPKETLPWEGIEEYLEATLKDDFNSADDPMEFRDKEKRLYRVIGRKKMVGNLQDSIPNRVVPGEKAESNVAIPTMPNLSSKIAYLSWPTNKKVEYERSIPATNSGADPPQLPEFAYPNQAYLPFVLLYNPDFAMYDPSYGNVGGTTADPDTEPVKVRFNDCHWFYDA